MISAFSSPCSGALSCFTPKTGHTQPTLAVNGPSGSHCDPSAVPARSSCAESALFQALIFKSLLLTPSTGLLFCFGFVFFSALSPIICFDLQVDDLFYLYQHLPMHSSCRTGSLDVSPAHSFLLFSLRIKQLILPEPSIPHVSVLFGGKNPIR